MGASCNRVPGPDELKLVALDKDDIEVVSAHCRTPWSGRRHFLAAARSPLRDGAQPLRLDERTRCESAGSPAAFQSSGTRRITGVAGPRCGSNGCWPANAAISIRPTRMRGSICSRSNSPKAMLRPGVVTLIFSGGGVIRLDVECLEAELADLGEVTTAAICPGPFCRRHARPPDRQAVRVPVLARRRGKHFISTTMTASVAA